MSTLDKSEEIINDKSPSFVFPKNGVSNDTETPKKTKKNNRATETIKTRKYRYTKKNPKSQKAIFKLDRGNVEQIISLTFPAQTELKSVAIPKEKNPNLKVMRLNRMKLACYVNFPNVTVPQIDIKDAKIFDELAKKNGVKVTFYKSNLKGKIGFEKGFVYDSDGNFSESFSLNDLKELYSEIGAFLKLLKTPKS